MTQTQIFDADVEAVEVEGLVLFTHEGKTRKGQRTPIIDKLDMVDAGFEAGFDFTMEVRLSQFVAPERAPANLDEITIDNVEYCIVGTTPDQLGIVNHYAVKQKS